jgi:hypothetical protein
VFVVPVTAGAVAWAGQTVTVIAPPQVFVFIDDGDSAVAGMNGDSASSGMDSDFAMSGLQGDSAMVGVGADSGVTDFGS